MNDKPQIKLSETVVLIDAAFLNFVITDMKGYFEETLRRSLQDIDLSMLTTYLVWRYGRFHAAPGPCSGNNEHA